MGATISDMLMIFAIMGKFLNNLTKVLNALKNLNGCSSRLSFMLDKSLNLHQAAKQKIRTQFKINR